MRVESPAEQLFFTTVRIETDTPEGIGAGTGFLFSYLSPDDPNKTITLFVTNKHVVEGATTGRFWFTRKGEDDNPIIGQKWDIVINDFERKWHGHPSPQVDVTIMAAHPVLAELAAREWHPYYRSILSSHIPTAEELDAMDAIEDVTFIGYPNGHFDRVNLVPLARRGTTASPPQLDYDGLPVFLIDASVFRGSSGSPVFIINAGSFTKGGNIVIGNRFHFMGLISAVFTADEEGLVEIVPIPTQSGYRLVTKQMIDIGVVFKARTVIETIEHALNCSSGSP